MSKRFPKEIALRNRYLQKIFIVLVFLCAYEIHLDMLKGACRQNKIHMRFWGFWRAINLVPKCCYCVEKVTEFHLPIPLYPLKLLHLDANGQIWRKHFLTNTSTYALTNGSYKIVEVRKSDFTHTPKIGGVTVFLWDDSVLRECSDLYLQSTPYHTTYVEVIQAP